MQLIWSGQRRMVEFCIINGTYWTVRTLIRETQKASVKTWTISKLSSKWHSWDFIQHHLCGPSEWWIVQPEITRVKFMEAQGARDQPPAIQYRSVHCDISPLILSSGSKEVTKVPVRCFLQIATASWNSMWERWLPDFQWRPVRGRFVRQRGFRKSPGRHTALQNSWWRLSSMDWDAGPGRARAEQCGPPRGQGVFVVVGVLAGAIKHILLAWTGKNSYYCVHASRGTAHDVPDSAGGLR